MITARRAERLLAMLLVVGLCACAAPPEPPPAQAAKRDAETLPQLQPTPQPLTVGEVISSAIGSGEDHDFTVALEADQYIRLSVEQVDVDLQLEWRDPAGQLQLQVDSPLGRIGVERLEAVASQSGRFGLRMHAFPGGHGGSYRVSIEDVRNASQQDVQRSRAAAVFAEAEQRLWNGQFETAAEQLMPLIQTWQSLGDVFEQGRTWDRLARCQMNLGQRQQAIQSFGHAVESLRQSEAWLEEGAALAQQGRLLLEAGEIRQADEIFALALSRAEQIDNAEGLALAANARGLSLQMLGQPQQALQVYQEALDVWKRLGKKQEIANTLHNRARLLMDLGNEEQAADQFLEAAAMWRGLEDPRRQAATLDQLAGLKRSAGDPQAALELNRQALELRARAGDERGKAVTLSNMGLALRLLGKLDDARQAHQQALEVFAARDQPRDMIKTLVNLAQLDVLEGQHAAAASTLTRAIGLAEELGDLPSEAEVWARLALVARPMGDLDMAQEAIEKAIGYFEALRGRLLQENLRVRFLEVQQDPYDFLVELLMQRHRLQPGHGFDRQAWRASEASRARALLDTLVSSPTDPQVGGGDQLRQQLAEVDRWRQHRLTQGHQPSIELEARTRALVSQLHELRRLNGGELQPSTSEEIQRLLDRDSVVLSYHLAAETGVLFVLDADSLTTFELPSRASLELLAHRSRELAAISHRREARTASRELLCRLGEILLGPAMDELAGRRLLIVADGALHSVPYAALPADTRQCNGEPLIAQHEVILLPSASVLARLRSRQPSSFGLAGEAAALVEPAAPVGITVFADPVFTASDSRVHAEARAEVQPSAAARRGGSWQRLPHSRVEAETISRLAPEEVTLNLDFDAAKETLLEGASAPRRILHFATHAAIDSRHPELSSIVLSAVDEFGQPRDGQLRLHELWRMRLASELVVLSGCRTALGQQLEGEGLIGLARGFLQAGAKSVVVSLWDVDDRATMELMSRFYKAMLEQDLPPASALRRAQATMASEPVWSAPAYWAGFEIFGDWR